MHNLFWLCSTQMTKPATTRVLRWTIHIWTWFLQIYRKTCLLLVYQNHHRPFLLGIKNRNSSYNHYLTLPTNIRTTTGQLFCFTLFIWVRSPIFLDIANRMALQFGKNGGEWTAFILHPNKSSINCKIMLKSSFWSPLLSTFNFNFILQIDPPNYYIHIVVMFKFDLYVWYILNNEVWYFIGGQERAGVTCIKIFILPCPWTGCLWDGCYTGWYSPELGLSWGPAN